MLQQARQQIPRSYSYFGFTTILDLTGESNHIANWNKNPLAPRALYCPLVDSERLSSHHDGERNPVQTSYCLPCCGILHKPRPILVASSKNNIRQNTSNLAQKVGSSCVKVFCETGFGPQRNLPVPSVEMIKAVVKEAHQRKMPVYLHGNSPGGLRVCL